MSAPRSLAVGLLLAACGSKESATRATPPSGGGGGAPAAALDAAAAAPAPTIDAATAPAGPSADDTAARVRGAHRAIAPGTSCITLGSRDDGRRLVSGRVDDAAVLCLVDPGTGLDHVGPLACWAVDATTGLLSYREPMLVPGRGIVIELDANGCAFGFCRPGGAGADDGAVIARSTDGDKVVLGPPPGADRGLVAHVFDGKTRALVRTVALDGDAGLTNSFTDLAFVGTTLFVRGVDAGPWAGVWAFGAGDVPLVDRSPLRHSNDPPRDPYGNVIAGGLHVLDRTRALIAEFGLTSAVVADAGRHDVTSVARKQPCTPAELDAWLTTGEPAPSRSCERYIKAEVDALADATITGLPDGDWLSASLATSQLRVIDPKTLTVRRSFPLPRCP